MLEIAEAVEKLCRKNGWSFRLYEYSYSGRGMFGAKSPLAIVTDAHPETGCGIELRSICGFSYDSLGRDEFIYYLHSENHAQAPSEGPVKGAAPEIATAYLSLHIFDGKLGTLDESMRQAYRDANADPQKYPRRSCASAALRLYADKLHRDSNVLYSIANALDNAHIEDGYVHVQGDGKFALVEAPKDFIDRLDADGLVKMLDPEED